MRKYSEQEISDLKKYFKEEGLKNVFEKKPVEVIKLKEACLSLGITDIEQFLIDNLSTPTLEGILFRLSERKKACIEYDKSWDGIIHEIKRPENKLYLEAIKGAEALLALAKAEIEACEEALKLPENQFKKDRIESFIEEYLIDVDIYEEEIQRLKGLQKRLLNDRLKLIKGGR